MPFDLCHHLGWDLSASPLKFLVHKLFGVASVFPLTMSEQVLIKVLILGEVSSPASNSTTKFGCSLESQSVHSRYS